MKLKRKELITPFLKSPYSDKSNLFSKTQELKSLFRKTQRYDNLIFIKHPFGDKVLRNFSDNTETFPSLSQ